MSAPPGLLAGSNGAANKSGAAPPGAIATRFAPSFRLTNAHFALGIAGLCGFALALLFTAPAMDGHFFQPRLLGLVHLCVLGWLLPIALGALHQLVPVVFEVPVRSERLVWVALVCYAAGAFAVAGHLWTFATGPGLAIGAATLFAAIALYAGQLFATLARARKVDLTGVHVIAALLFLVVAAGLGLALAWNLHAPFLYADHLLWLRAHAHAGALGFFALLIMGVAYRLFEMFLVSHGAPRTAGWVALVATSAALVATIVNFVFGHVRSLSIVAGAGAAIGAGAFLAQVRAIFRRRARRRTDIAWRYSAAALGYLALAVAAGIALAWGGVAPPARTRLELAYGILAILGFAGSMVLGQLLKIVPFLVWFHRFSPYVGLKKIPTAAELLPQKWQGTQWALAHAGVAALLSGVLAGVPALRAAGAASFFAAAALYARTIAAVYRRRP